MAFQFSFDYVIPLKKRQRFQFVGRTFERKNNTLKVLPGTKISVSDPAGALMTFDTDSGGLFVAEFMELETYNITANKSGFFQFDTIMNATYRKDTLDIIMNPIETQVDIKLDNIYFDFNSYKLNDRSMATIQNIASFLKENPEIIVQLSAHTDTRGDEKYNLDLSEKRAKEIRKHLINEGINPARMRAVGYGESLPVVKEARTEEEHEQNRRTQFRVLDRLSYPTFDPDEILRDNGSYYIIQFRPEKQPMDHESPLLKNVNGVEIAVRDSEIIYFFGPYTSKRDVRNKLRDISEYTDKEPDVHLFRNKTEVY